MYLLYLTVSILIVLSLGMNTKGQNTKVVYQWKQLEFNFPTEQDRRQAEANGNLIPANNIPIDVQPNYYNKNLLRTFVTIPRFQGGIPYSLATISQKQGANGPVLEPYPNYEVHNYKNGRKCDGIISAFRVVITQCQQMWVIDSGMIGLETFCPPQLLLIDLNTNKIIHRYPFNKSLYTPGASLFITVAVDVRDPPGNNSCRNSMLYVADVNYHGLVVYDALHNNAWRIENMFMYPDPNYGLHTVAGESFVLMDGIFGIAVDKRNLYFHPLASATEYSVPLEVLDNSQGQMYEKFRPLGKRSSECTATSMDSNNNLYCVTLNPIELIQWNVNTEYNSKNLKKLPINPAELQFVSGMKVVKNHQGNEELWMMSNKFQKISVGTQDFSEVNFRVVVLPLANVNPTTAVDDLHNKLIFKD